MRSEWYVDMSGMQELQTLPILTDELGIPEKLLAAPDFAAFVAIMAEVGDDE